MEKYLFKDTFYAFLKKFLNYFVTNQTLSLLVKIHLHLCKYSENSKNQR